MLTLKHDVSVEFRNLNVWLEGTKQYERHMAPSHLPASRRCAITFRIVDHKMQPLPSVHYLHLHAACARVAHKSGATTYIDELAKDNSRITVLAEDGSSASVLAAALARVVAI
ncbi:hypothetical protein F5148DRAFT_1237958 [Russula earlei]|uniref:Uncharacterized protein n=1 Tax=Russula earlei TaxID=71964 RepID=A0ACC0TWL5_9AGAM|nr:hypothetical protein F5148DRAFT_1237958 [Russula earlei]